MQPKAVVLVSGGMDSTTILAIAKALDFDCYALTYNYNQRNRSELESAKRVAKALGASEHKIIDIDLSQFGGSALTDNKIEVPNYTGSKEIPNTYVPARNTIFLSVALAWAETIDAYDIFYGANSMDYFGYPDCKPEYMRAFENLANLATKIGVNGRQFKIHAPLIEFDKKEIIKAGVKLAIDYSMTVSCYRADDIGRACKTCDACTYRRQGFIDACIPDPTLYVK